MAGQPRKRAMIEELERRAEEFDGGTVLEYVEDYVGNGGDLTRLAVDLSTSLQHGESYVTRHMVSKYLNALPGGSRVLSAARGEGAHGLVDQAIAIVDQVAESKEEIAANKNAAEMRVKIAGFWNKAEYQPMQKNAVNVNLDLGQLHLDALRQRVVPAIVVSPLELPAGPDVEQG